MIAAVPAARPPIAQAVIVGGTLAAVLDIVFAISFAAFNGVGPVRLLQTVASGLLGMAAFAGGWPTAALGLVLHFGMSYLWAALFVIVASRFAPATYRPLVYGAAFGIGVLVVMRLVVLPLSAFPRPVTFAPVATILDLLSHMFLFGVPIASAARRVLVPGSRNAADARLS